MKTLNQFLEQVEPAKETEKEDPKVKQAQKKDNMMKRRVLMTKMRALRQGAKDITASYEPEGEELTELSKRTLGNYVKDASSDAAMTSMDHGNKPLAKDAPKREKKILKRLSGIRKATDKLSKEEVEVNEGVMKMIKSVTRKKKEKKAEKAMDAGARARRKVARRVHAKYVSGSEDNVPDDIREAKVDAGKSPEGKEAARNKRKFGTSHNQAKTGALRRSLHKIRRGDKKIKGEKPYYGDSGYAAEGKKNPNNLVEPRDGVDSAKEVNRATRKAAFRPFNKEEVQVNEANRAEKEAKASDLAKVGKRNINRFETGTVKRTESSGGRRPTSKTVTLANPKPGYGKRTDHYKKNKLSAPELGSRGTSSATEPGPQKHHTQGVTHHDSAQRQRRQEHKARRGVKTKGTVAADIKKSLKEEDKAYQYVVSKLKKKYGDGVLTKGDKIKPKTAAQKKAAAAHQAKVDRENAAERAKDPSQGRYPPGYSNRGSD